MVDDLVRQFAELKSPEVKVRQDRPGTTGFTLRNGHLCRVYVSCVDGMTT